MINTLRCIDCRDVRKSRDDREWEFKEHMEVGICGYKCVRDWSKENSVVRSSVYVLGRKRLEIDCLRVFDKYKKYEEYQIPDGVVGRIRVWIHVGRFCKIENEGF